MQELTKKEAIRLHREMWNWIAERAEKGKRGDYISQRHNILLLKKEFLRDIKQIYYWSEIPLSNCYCCEYAKQQHEKYDKDEQGSICDYCPLVWGTENAGFFPTCCNDYYDYTKDSPKRIANLPEKEGV